MKNRGLDSTQIEILREKTGLNELPDDNKLTWPSILFSQLKSPLIYILIIVSTISFFYKELFDFLLINGVIALNVFMGFIQEYKAFRTSEKLKALVSPHALVIRDGIRKKISIKYLVPQDLIVLGAGDRVPADSILLEGINLLVKEAILTGEEEAVSKNTKGDNELYMGTHVIGGKGIARVEKIGRNTEIGKIGKSLITIPQLKTPLQKSLEEFSRKLGVLVLILCSIIFLIGFATGKDFWVMLRLSIILSIAAIPEGLPIAVTVILSISANRILKMGGLIKGLFSVETLGSTTVICLDKTGTLTMGDMKVVKADFVNEGEAISSIILSNEQRTNFEVALWNYIKKNYKNEFEYYQKKAFRKYEEPFTSEKKYSFTLGQIDGHELAYIIGAPDIVINFCNLSFEERKRIEEEINDWTSRGLRLLAFAYKQGKDLRNLTNFKWNGIVAIEDPLRVEAEEVIKLAEEAGLKIKIVTGDHKETGLRVAQELGLKISKNNIVEGKELDKISRKDLVKGIDEIILFARVTPNHKLKIVEALQARNEVVAMTGDGVNDAQALKRADIGVVMGDSSDLAKESGDLILTNNDFRTIIKAIEQGRLIFANMKKVVAYVLSDSFEELILIFGAFILGLPAPLSVAQILWIHLICDGPPDITLGFEKEEGDLMTERNLNSNGKVKKILDKSLYFIIFGVSLITGILALVVFILVYKYSNNLGLAQTATFASIATVDLFYVISFKSLRYPVLNIKRIFDNKWMIWASIYGFSLLVIGLYIPFVRRFIGTVTLPLPFLTIQLGIAFIAILWVEVVKYFVRKNENSI